MGSVLLEKEVEYYKLNDELQKRNKELMKEFDNIVKKQDDFLKETLNDNKFDDIAHKNYTSRIESKNSYQLRVSRISTSSAKLNCKNNDNLPSVPDSVDQMGVKGITAFYKAKIKSMENYQDKLQLENKTKQEEVKQLQKEKAKLVEDKEKVHHTINTYKINLSELENEVVTLNSKCQIKENEIASFRKEIEQLKKNLKNTHSNTAANELRLNRALEENDKMKNALKIAKQEEKDLKESNRKELAEFTSLVKKLEKQKAELMVGFKKQILLIENLKKQKAFVEALKIAEISENEFTKILNWKMQD